MVSAKSDKLTAYARIMVGKGQKRSDDAHKSSKGLIIGGYDVMTIYLEPAPLDGDAEALRAKDTGRKLALVGRPTGSVPEG